jgi:hypothetical protein
MNCTIEQNRAYRAANPEKRLQWAKTNYANNRDKHIASATKWGNEHREIVVLRAARSNAKKGGFEPPNITEKDLRELMQNHAPKCAMAGCEMAWKHLDHCHKTGKVRGLLCIPHNHLLGCAHDSIEELQDAVEYLRKAT